MNSRRLLVIALLVSAAVMYFGADKEVTEEEECQRRGGVYVVEDHYGESWPLTVESACIECRKAYAYVITAKGTEYALNGIALGQGYEEVNAIWKEHPNPELAAGGAMVSIHPLMQVAKGVCR